MTGNARRTGTEHLILGRTVGPPSVEFVLPELARRVLRRSPSGSLFATLECELLDRSTFQTPSEAEAGVFEFLDGWYNPHRRHSALGQLSPAEFERRPAGQERKAT